MRIEKRYYVAIGIFIAFLLGISGTIIGLTQIETETSNLAFKGKPDKESIVLGEPITIQFEISNNGETPIKVHVGGVETGFLKVLIAGQDGDFKRYFGYGWGLLMGKMSNLSPDSSHKYKEVAILWNGKIDVSGLNDHAAKEKLKGKISTEYAFPEPGVYFVKGLSYVGENAVPIESKPIKILVREPEGIDLEVWKQIKGNAEIALLMQSGGFNTGKEEEKQELIEQVEQIIERYPDSIYSSYLKPNLEKYKVDELRRKESLKKAIIKPKN